jgi:phenylalanyl-tRNA synthetase beta chain
VTARPVPVAQAVPKHQAVERDIAIVVAESVTHDALMQAIRAATAAQGLLRDAALFDIYRPQPLRDGAAAAPGALAQGEKSMAVRLSFQSDSATLTDEQVEPAVRAIVEQLGATLGGRLRG